MSSSNRVVAFILLVLGPQSLENNYDNLKNHEKVKEFHMIYGDYDVIIKCQLNNLQELTTFMLNLREIYDIKKSSTLITLAE